MGGKNSAGLQSNTRHTAAKRAPVAPTTGGAGAGLGNAGIGNSLQPIPSMEDLQELEAPTKAASMADQSLKVPTTLNPFAPLQTGINPPIKQGTIFRQRRDLESILINNVETRVDEVATAMGKTLGIPEDQIAKALKNLDIVFSKSPQEDEKYRLGRGTLASFTHVPELYDPSLSQEQKNKIIKERETNFAEALKHGQITFSHAFLQGLKDGHINDLPQVALHEIGHFLVNQKSGGDVSRRNRAAEEATVELVAQSMAPTPTITYQGSMLSLLLGMRDQHPEMSDEEIVGHIVQAGLLQNEQSIAYIDAANPKKQSDAQSITSYPTTKFGPEYLAKIRELLHLPYEEQKGAFKAIKEKDRDYYYEGPKLQVSEAEIGRIVKAATKKIKDMGFNIAPEQEIDTMHAIRMAKKSYAEIKKDSKLPQKHLPPQQIKGLLPLWEELAPIASLGTPSTDEEKAKQDKAFDSLVKQAAEIRKSDEIARNIKDSVQEAAKVFPQALRQIIVPQMLASLFNQTILGGHDLDAFRGFVEKYPDALSKKPPQLVGAERAQMKRVLGTAIYTMQLTRQKILQAAQKDLGIREPLLSSLTQYFFDNFTGQNGLYASLADRGLLSKKELAEMNTTIAKALQRAAKATP